MRLMNHGARDQTLVKIVLKTSTQLTNVRRLHTSASTRPGRAVDSACSMGSVRHLHSGRFNVAMLGLMSCNGASGRERTTHEGNTAFSAMRSDCKVSSLATHQFPKYIHRVVLFHWKRGPRTVHLHAVHESNICYKRQRSCPVRNQVAYERCTGDS